ncbi:ATP-binding cassette domain-containing protein [Leptolinea tardivitalis]|nr:ATP-binding cassette domain-containing protein [Leptolinea tardivitalis]GAP21373.1 ABC-type multidrug transport system, ATPase component [Leptolinea tardivitalis]
MMHSIIETRNITRKFGKTKAVNNLSLQVPPGCIYGFLGPNGAGKTTTIRMLLGLIRPDAGTITMFGRSHKDCRMEILQRTGSLVESPSLYPHLTGRENLELIRRLTGRPTKEINRVLSIVGMEADSNRLVREYSLGMRQRMGLAVALFGQPELLILDEPTNGLDPAGIHEIRELISRLPYEGITVFLSSHLLSEVEQMATRIGILQDGSLIFQGSPDELRSRFQDYAAIITDRLDETRQFLQDNGWNAVHLANHHLTVLVNGPSDAAMINTQLVNAGHQVYELSLVHPSLEDIFLTLTGK